MEFLELSCGLLSKYLFPEQVLTENFVFELKVRTLWECNIDRALLLQLGKRSENKKRGRRRTVLMSVRGITSICLFECELMMRFTERRRFSKRRVFANLGNRSERRRRSEGHEPKRPSKHVRLRDLYCVREFRLLEFEYISYISNLNNAIKPPSRYSAASPGYKNRTDADNRRNNADKPVSAPTA